MCCGAGSAGAAARRRRRRQRRRGRGARTGSLEAREHGHRERRPPRPEPSLNLEDLRTMSAGTGGTSSRSASATGRTVSGITSRPCVSDRAASPATSLPAVRKYATAAVPPSLEIVDDLHAVRQHIEGLRLLEAARGLHCPRDRTDRLRERGGLLPRAGGRPPAPIRSRLGHERVPHRRRRGDARGCGELRRRRRGRRRRPRRRAAAGLCAALGGTRSDTAYSPEVPPVVRGTRRSPDSVSRGRRRTDRT